jgi:hypothetical protein
MRMRWRDRRPFLVFVVACRMKVWPSIPLYAD